MKRRQYLICKFLRDVIKQPIISDSRLKEYGHLISSLQERLGSAQNILPYARYFQGKGRITDYPEELQAQAFITLGKLQNVDWHMLAMEYGVYVKDNRVRVADW